jgi:ABC-type multidrug transport system fused ATPase/permease subunit
MIGLTVDAIGTGEQRNQGFAGFWLDRAHSFAGDDRERLVVFFGGVVLALWLLRWAVAIGATYLVQKLGQTVVNDFRVDVYRHITSMDQGWFHKNPVGRLVNRTTFDLQAISELFSDAFAEGMRDMMFILVLIVVMLSIDPVMAGILLCAFPALLASALVYRWAARPAMRTMSAVQSRMNAWLAENLAGMREIHVYRRERQRTSEYQTFTDAHQASARAMIQAWGLLRPVMMAISAVFTALILWVGYNRVSAGLATVGVLLTFLQYTTRLWVPVRNLTEKFNMIQNSLTAGERIMDVLDAKSAMVDGPDVDASLRVERGAITFEDVRFRYPDTDPEILKGINLAVQPGQMLALVGDTGAGKSTIVHLISRFYDASAGRVCVDGRDVRDFALTHLRAGTALVPQDVVIFAGTIRENIALGHEVSDERIWECLEAVRADGIVRSLEGDLDHVLEERGRTLSVGERQLISFARALVLNPPILILDEATASVDTETELRIQKALEELTEGRTSVVIAHRLSTIRNADQIAVLRHGEVIELGTHQELIAAGGEYARLQELHSNG